MSIERERNNQLIQGLGPKAYTCTNTYVHTYIWTRIFLFTNQTCFNRHLHIQAIKFSSRTHMNFTRLHFHPREHVSILVLAEEIRTYREPRYRFSDLSAPVSITVKSPGILLHSLFGWWLTVSQFSPPALPRTTKQPQHSYKYWCFTLLKDAAELLQGRDPN